MIIVKIFGVFRLDTGVSQLELESDSVRELIKKLPEKINAVNPNAKVKASDLKGCIISVNGKQVKLNEKLKDGDIVWLIPAVAGG